MKWKKKKKKESKIKEKLGGGEKKKNLKGIDHCPVSFSLPLRLFRGTFLLAYLFPVLHRNVCSAKTSLALLFMYTGRVHLESILLVAVNAGTLLSTAQNVPLPYPLKVLFTWPANLKTLIASVTLKATVITFTKERCAWDSGLVNAMGTVMETMTPLLDGILCPAYS